MSALDDLGRSLARAVDAGAASGHATAPAPHPRRRREPTPARRRGRHGWRGFLTILVAGGITTGALAATGNLPIISSGDREANPNYSTIGFPGMLNEATRPPTLLPMRVKDPRGGPEWALRTFPIGRGVVCAQGGQLYRGKFGIVTQTVDRNAAPSANGPAPAKTVFQELPAAASVFGVRCGAARTDGRLVAANRATSIMYPDGTDLRCRSIDPPFLVDPCPITSVTVIRWGFLGPRARTATFGQPDGGRGPTRNVEAATGGAYLFAERVDPKPFIASRRFERRLRGRIEQRKQTLAATTPALAHAEQMRQLIAYMRSAGAAARKQRQANWRAQQAEAVDATFDGAPARRVAGPGAKGGPLPGVAPLVTSIPKVGRARVTATYRGAERAIEVRFASPVALDAHPGSYAISIRGPQDGRCGRPGSSQAEYAKEAAAGEPLLVRVRPTGGRAGSRLSSWCPGSAYDVRVRHVVRNSNKPGLRSEQLVGTTRVVAR